MTYVYLNFDNENLVLNFTVLQFSLGNTLEFSLLCVLKLYCLAICCYICGCCGEYLIYLTKFVFYFSYVIIGLDKLVNCFGKLTLYNPDVVDCATKVKEFLQNIFVRHIHSKD